MISLLLLILFVPLCPSAPQQSSSPKDKSSLPSYVSSSSSSPSSRLPLSRHNSSPSAKEESIASFSKKFQSEDAVRRDDVTPETPLLSPSRRNLGPKKDSKSVEAVELEGVVNKTGVTVWLGGKKIYASSDNLWKGNKTTYHAGVHVIVLHEHRLAVMQKEQFHTWQPASQRMLAKMLAAVQHGRIVVLVGVPDFTVWFGPEGMQYAMRMGCRLGALAARGESWAMVAPKGHPPLMEALSTSRNASYMDVSPLRFSATITKAQQRHCPWYSEPGMALRAEFCELYEGYGEFCRCKEHIMPDPKLAPHMKEFELIPVAMVTAKRLPSVLRQVVKIWRNPGGSFTPINIFVDGYNPEAEMLGKILNITVVFHKNPARIGSIHRVNQHIRFALENIFKSYPKADKAIILEDDLDISPDFISYFQQVSLLMAFDETISFVNAYNYNAYPHTACDPTRIYRVQSYPYYGWLTKRKVAEAILEDWAPMDSDADWDLYIRKYHIDEWHQVVIPEVPRTKHEGGLGVHVSGAEQELTFQQRPLNMERDVSLNMIRIWEIAYSIDLTKKIARAQVVNITRHPCDEEPIPRQKNETHVIYINLTGEEDTEKSYRVLGMCMGFYHHYRYEHFHGTFSMKYFETPFVIVSCPSSAFCWEVPPSVIYKPSEDDFQYARNNSWRHSNASAELAIRVEPFTPEEEFRLDNTYSTSALIPLRD